MTATEPDDAERVLRLAVEIAADTLDARLDAAFALGSLAHGGFAPLVSDVDLALIVTEVDAGLPGTMAGVAERVRDRSPSPVLAARLSIFWTDWPGVHQGARTPSRLPAADRRDLIEHGRLLLGTDRRAGAVPPEGADLVREAADFALERFGPDYLARLHRPDELVADGARTVTKAVLFPVRFLHTLASGQVGHNDAAAGWYARAGAHPRLVAAALSWRHRGLPDPNYASALLDAELPGLYVEFFQAYAQALERGGDHRRAAAVRDRADRIRRPDPPGSG